MYNVDFFSDTCVSAPISLLSSQMNHLSKLHRCCLFMLLLLVNKSTGSEERLVSWRPHLPEKLEPPNTSGRVTRVTHVGSGCSLLFARCLLMLHGNHTCRRPVSRVRCGRTAVTVGSHAPSPRCVFAEEQWGGDDEEENEENQQTGERKCKLNNLNSFTLLPDSLVSFLH